jgi:hypothetical protein
MITADDLHRAADRVGDEAGSPYMDELADAAAQFIQRAALTDEFGVAFSVDGPSLGYGVMLGYLAALQAPLNAYEANQMAMRAVGALKRPRGDGR